MSIREIIKEPTDTLLRQKARRVDNIDRKIRSILDDMAETLQNASGNGLAAPQVGEAFRLIVVKNEGKILKLINPMIVKTRGAQLSLEGCLSLPGLCGIVKRPEFVLIHALDEAGESVEIKAFRSMAAVYAHEIDHLEGILLTDKIKKPSASK